jgi:membrane protein required for colicin V production
MILDILVLASVAAAIYKGYTKGLIVGLFSFVALLVGAAAAIKLGAMAGKYLEMNTSLGGKWTPLLGFLFVFVCVVLLVKLAAGFIEKSVEAISLGWINKVGGIAFFLLIHLTIVSILMFYIAKLGVLTPRQLADSQTYPLLSPLAPALMDFIGMIVPLFRDLFGELESFFEGMAGQAA